MNGAVMSRPLFTKGLSMTGYNVNGTLPIGLIYEGCVHKEFTLRPAKVRDTLQAEEENPKGTNLEINLSVYSKRLEKLGSIPKEKITPDLLADLYDTDLAELTKCDIAQQKKMIAPTKKDDKKE
jgi:hypothetical protein